MINRLLNTIITLVSIGFTYAQNDFALPELPMLHSSVDTFHNSTANIQASELRQTKRFRWLSYLPSPGYSPFAGGFTVSLNVTGPLHLFQVSPGITDLHLVKRTIIQFKKQLNVQESFQKRGRLIALRELRDLVLDKALPSYYLEIQPGCTLIYRVLFAKKGKSRFFILVESACRHLRGTIL